MKTLLYGILTCGMLFSCSSKEESTSSNTNVSPLEDTTVVVLEAENSTETSLYVDTLTISFAEGQDYTIYVEEYSEQGSKGSLRHFIMHDQAGREVFRSFDEDLEIAESSADEQWIFALYPNYQVVREGRTAVISINLLYADSPLEQNAYNPEVEVPEGFLPMKSISNKGNMYIVGRIQNSDDLLNYKSLYEPYPCTMSFDSLVSFYKKEKEKDTPSAIDLLSTSYYCSLQDKPNKVYDSIAFFSINVIRDKIEFDADYEKYYYLFRFLTYHAWYPFLR